MAVKDKIPTLIFVSRLVKMKGVEEVIKAFFIIQKKIPNIRLHIVGDGEDRYVKTVRAKFKIDKKGALYNDCSAQIDTFKLCNEILDYHKKLANYHMEIH